MLTTSFTSTPNTPSHPMVDVNTPEIRFGFHVHSATITNEPGSDSTTAYGSPTRSSFVSSTSSASTAWLCPKMTRWARFYLLKYYFLARRSVQMTNDQCILYLSWGFTLSSSTQIDMTSIPGLALDYRCPSSRVRLAIVMFRFSSTLFLTWTSKYNRIPLYIERDKRVLVCTCGQELCGEE